MKKRELKKNFGVVAVITSSMYELFSIYIGIIYSLLFILIMIEMESLSEKISWTFFLLVPISLVLGIYYYGNKTNRIEYGEGKVFVVKKVQFRDEHGKLVGKLMRLEEEFLAEDVVKIDYAENFHRPVRWVEPKYRADFPEMQFETKEGEGVRKVMAGMLPKDKYNLFHYIYNRSGTAPEEGVCKKEGISRSSLGRRVPQAMKKYGYRYFSAYKKDCIEIGEGKLVSTVNGKRTELSVEDIKEMKFTEETEEVLFEMKDGRIVKVNLRFLKKKKDLFYYIYWRGGIRPNEDICRRFHLKLDEHEE